jgi:hypothetical protein
MVATAFCLAGSPVEPSGCSSKAYGKQLTLVAPPFPDSRNSANGPTDLGKRAARAALPRTRMNRMSEATTSALDVCQAALPVRSESPQYADAFARVLPVAMALDSRELAAVNIDIPNAVTLVLGKLPGIVALRPSIQEQLTFDIRFVDHLETFVLATAHAHALCIAAAARSESIDGLAGRAGALRDLLYSDAEALAKRGLVSRARLRQLRTSSGYKNLAFDLLGLSVVLRESWPIIHGKTAIELSDLAQAERLGEALLNAIGRRERAPAVASALARQRQRVFTLFFRAYDQVRRAVCYLRWNERDADRIAPSLYVRRRKRRKPHTDVERPRLEAAVDAQAPSSAPLE